MTPEALARMDDEDRRYDPPGLDWDRIIEESEADRRAGRVMTMDEFIRVTTERGEDRSGELSYLHHGSILNT